MAFNVAVFEGRDVLIFALGSMVKRGEAAVELLREKGISATLVNARFAKPLDSDFLISEMGKYKLVCTLEENVITGGFGQQVESLLHEGDFKGQVLKIAVPDRFIKHGNVSQLFLDLKMDEASIAERIAKTWKEII